MEKICGIVELTGFFVAKKFYCRELGFAETCWDCEPKSVRFDLTPVAKRIAPISRKGLYAIRCVESFVTGLPDERESRGKVSLFPPDDFDRILRDFYEGAKKTPLCDVLAYKGGRAAREALANLNIPSANLEDYGCPTYEELVARNSGSSSSSSSSSGRYRQCGHHHVNETARCAQAEVQAFKEWLEERV